MYVSVKAGVAGGAGAQGLGLLQGEEGTGDTEGESKAALGWQLHS